MHTSVLGVCQQGQGSNGNTRHSKAQGYRIHRHEEQEAELEWQDILHKMYLWLDFKSNHKYVLGWLGWLVYVSRQWFCFVLHTTNIGLQIYNFFVCLFRMKWKYQIKTLTKIMTVEDLKKKSVMHKWSTKHIPKQLDLFVYFLLL